MAKTFLFTTDQSNFFIVALGKDATDAKVNAEISLQTRPGVKIQGMQEITHSVVVSLDVILLNKAPSDDILIKRINEHFDGRAKIELQNVNNEDGSVVKRFLVDGKEGLHVNLKTKEQAEDYQENGLGEAYIKVLLDNLEVIVRKQAPEISPALGDIVMDNGTSEEMKEERAE